MYIYQNWHQINHFNMTQWRCHNWVKKTEKKWNNIFLHYGPVSLTLTNNLHPTVGRPTAGLQTFPDFVKHRECLKWLIDTAWVFFSFCSSWIHNTMFYRCCQRKKWGWDCLCFLSRDSNKAEIWQILKVYSKRHQKINEEVIQFNMVLPEATDIG